MENNEAISFLDAVGPSLLKEEPAPPSRAGEMAVPYQQFGPVQNVSRYVTICSIYPAKLQSQWYHHGVGRKQYFLDAGSLDSPQYLRVYDTFTVLMNTNSSSPDTKPDYFPQPVPCITERGGGIAMDLLKEWGGDHPAVAGTPGVLQQGARCIGVFLCRGDVATAAELELAKKNQDAFFRAIISKADEDFANGRKNANWTEARRAAEYMGITDSATHPWFPVLQRASHCPYCAESILINAIACKHCQKDIPNYYMERGLEVDATAMPRVAEEIEYRKKKKSVR